MSIVDTIDSIRAHLSNAYDAIETKEGIIPENKNIENLKDSILSITAGGLQPQLHSVTITRINNILNISNPSTNGDYVDGYYIYDGDELVQTQSNTTYDLFNLGSGTHSVTVVAYSEFFEDSVASSALVFNSYTVTNALTNLITSNPAALIISGSEYNSILSASSGYYIPDTITVTVNGTSVSSVYNNMTGEISIPALTIVGDINIIAIAATTPKLDAPIISLAGSVISWDAITDATSYDIYVDGVQSANTTNVSYDLKNVLSVDGTYDITVVAKASGYRDSNASNTVSFTYLTVITLGVSGLYDSNPLLTRTDDAVGLSAVVNSSTGLVSSDFDSLFPWSDVTVETINGNKFVHMPDMWFRIGKDTSNNITDVAVSNAQGDTGKWYKVDSFYYSCYGGSIDANSKLCSISGVSRVTQTINEFRTAAAANGSGYFQLDLYHHMVMLFLWWIEFATKNSKSIMTGREGSYGSGAVNTGGTDGLSTPSGYNTTTGQMRYHYIEDFVGNYQNFVDGVFLFNKMEYYVTDNPSNFSDNTTGKYRLSYDYSGGNIRSIGWDSRYPFLCPAKECSGTTYDTYFCGRSYVGDNIAVPAVGIDAGSVFAGYSISSFTYIKATNSVHGGRLLYKPTT